MRLPADAVISMDKLRDYRLTELPRGDTSRFLGQAGYTRSHAGQLERDLREQVLSLDAAPLPPQGYGERYEIRAPLRGPNAAVLPVRTIWMREYETNIVKFIPPIPLRRGQP